MASPPSSPPAVATAITAGDGSGEPGQASAAQQRPDLKQTRSRTSSSVSGRVRSASVRLANASIPTGAWSGVGQTAGRAPSLADLKRGSISSSESAGSSPRLMTSSRQATWSSINTPSLPATKLQSHPETAGEHDDAAISIDSDLPPKAVDGGLVEGTTTESVRAKPNTVETDATKHHPLPHRVQPVANDLGIYPNGYHFPPPKTWTEATWLGLKGLTRFTLTPVGFLIVIYGCNVIAWGGMIFLLLVNAAPVMCHLGDGRVDCNDINSPRRVWIEIDSQVLTALFCVTAFGLAPWRFRDLWYWGLWRMAGRTDALRKLAGYKKGWFRLQGSEDLPEGFGPESDESTFAEIEEHLYPLPRKNIPPPPLTGARAPPTQYWKLDFVVWSMVWNTFFQVVLCGVMWGLNRYDRPSWTTGLFVALACIVAGLGGVMEGGEGKRVKAIEGVPLSTAKAIADLESSGSNSQTERGKRNSGSGGNGEEKPSGKSLVVEV